MNTVKRYDIEGTMLNLYTEGEGAVTLIIMSGNGVTCPVLEYKPVYRRLSRKYRIAVIEKAGYGCSDGTDKPRTLEQLVLEDRELLKAAGIAPPYVLVPHSYSGFEAVYWANTYPEEVRAVLSMDMGVPELAVKQSEVIGEENRLKALERQAGLLKKIAKNGLFAKLIKNRTENVSGLMTGNELTAEEKEEYRRLFYKNIANREYREESRLMTENAAKAAALGELKCPCCFFISDMKMMAKSLDWRSAGEDFARRSGGEIHFSDKGHMMYGFIPDEIAGTFDAFLTEKGLAD